MWGELLIRAWAFTPRAEAEARPGCWSQGEDTAKWRDAAVWKTRQELSPPVHGGSGQEMEGARSGTEQPRRSKNWGHQRAEVVQQGARLKEQEMDTRTMRWSTQERVKGLKVYLWTKLLSDLVLSYLWFFRNHCLGLLLPIAWTYTLCLGGYNSRGQQRRLWTENCPSRSVQIASWWGR